MEINSADTLKNENNEHNTSQNNIDNQEENYQENNGFSKKQSKNEEDEESSININQNVNDEYIEKTFYGNPNYLALVTGDLSTIIKSKRTQLIKTIIVRPRKEFEFPVSFNDKGPGEEGGATSFDIKPVKTNEYPMADQAYLDIGLQTSSEYTVKSYQVPKMRTKNANTQVEANLNDIVDKFENKANFYLTNVQKLNDIENFLQKVRPRMEESLQSNETIDIFLNDFDLDRSTFITNSDVNEKGESKVEMRTFRDNLSAGQKSKKEKSVNFIKIISMDECYIAHSLIRNLTFEERTKSIGIPYQTQILFWNFKDHEINSPVFTLDVPMEISTFDFCPTNPNILICGLLSGQLIIYEINDLIGILHKSNDSEYQLMNKKSKDIFLIFNLANRKDLYTFFITPNFESHKTHITSMKWFPKNFGFTKYNLVANNSNETTILATLAEDGQVLIWDIKNFDRSIKNDTSNYIKPVIRVEINKLDCKFYFLF